MLINDPGFSSKILQVLRNTLIMSGLGIATSWLPIAFAILLAEIRSTKFQRTVQTLTTIPNFLSWVLVYAVALSIFSADGLLIFRKGERPDMHNGCPAPELCGYIA